MFACAPGKENAVWSKFLPTSTTNPNSGEGEVVDEFEDRLCNHEDDVEGEIVSANKRSIQKSDPCSPYREILRDARKNKKPEKMPPAMNPNAAGAIEPLIAGGFDTLTPPASSTVGT